MIRPQRNIQIPLRYRSNSFSQFEQVNKQSKRRRIDLVTIDRNNVDQILIVIKSVSEYIKKLSILISIKLFQFKVNYVQNRIRFS